MTILSFMPFVPLRALLGRKPPAGASACTTAPELHAEDAVARRGHGGLQRGVERETERGAGLQRIDHAVVPDARGAVVRTSLGLVGGHDLVVHGLLEGRIQLRS